MPETVCKKGRRCSKGKSRNDLPIKQGFFLNENAPVSLYLKQIGKNKPLSGAEEAELARRIRGGDKKALRRLVKSNLRFAVGVAFNYQHQGLSLSDLINEANIGLIKAARRFDESKGFKFISYAVWWIRQSILQALAEHSRIVKLPLNRVHTIQKLGKAATRLEQRLMRKPGIEELSKETGIQKEETVTSLCIGNTHTSLDAPLSNDDGGQRLDFLEDSMSEQPDGGITQISLRKEIEDILETLSPTEQAVIKLYFGIGTETTHTLQEIGIILDLSRERVRQVKEVALRRLKHPSRSRRLRMHRT